MTKYKKKNMQTVVQIRDWFFKRCKGNAWFEKAVVFSFHPQGACICTFYEKKDLLEAQVNRQDKRKKQVQNQYIYIFYKQKDLLEAQTNQLAKRKKQV